MFIWLLEYEHIVNNRHLRGEISRKTLSDYHRLIKFCREHLAHIRLEDITVADISHALADKTREVPHSARRLRINLSNLFIEAQRAGRLAPGYNPALITRPVTAQVKTSRLTLQEWLRIFRCAKYRAPGFFQIAMLLSLVTAQRPSDVRKMHADDISDGYLHITQQKTGEKIALPVTLHLDAISTSLSDILDICPRTGYLICDRHGQPVNTWSLSRWFRLCREQVQIDLGSGETPPTFREHRSLAERLYRAQNLDTRTLLGHRYQQMTDQYNNPRGKEYRKLLIP
ncbi:tyrosine-type recombinase/integrase (plasmid) [Cedecea neteri]|uniref:tyrosine-type recombinase/integrase n=1 Tax=Cedecea neteri TaxID=158822 RepID=UPI002892D167|nr:tyrosine-type recombinase/integrase [Cedecea neteri]WNJ82236.1 tyrosine-type recombinase/integrase [Cedecea neteri]